MPISLQRYQPIPPSPDSLAAGLVGAVSCKRHHCYRQPLIEQKGRVEMDISNSFLTCLHARLDPAGLAGFEDGYAPLPRHAGGRASDANLC